MTDVRMPDGQVVRFPDDMPKEQIKGLIASKYPETARPDLSAAVGKSAPIPPTVGQDMGTAFLGGVGKGLEMTAGIGGDTMGILSGAGRFLGDKGRALMGKAPLSPAQEQKVRSLEPNYLPSSGDVAGAVGAVAPGVQKVVDYKPETRAGKFANTAGMFAGASAFGGPRAAVQSIPAAMGSEAAGQLTEGTPLEPYARVAGSFAPAMLRKAITPNPMSASRRQAVDTLKREGVTEITAGQATGSNALRYKESELGAARLADVLDRQGEQFTSAVLRRAGINANRATPEVIDQAFTRIGQQFDDFAAQNAVRLDMQAQGEIRQALNEFIGNTGPGVRPPVVDQVARGLLNLAHVGGGQTVINGGTYSSLRSLIGKRIATLQKANPAGADALRSMQNALDGALERTVLANNPSAAQAIRDARRQYRNMLVIEKAATGAGEMTAQGIISPMQLRTATKSVFGLRSFARGRDEFSHLAKAGEAILKPLPQSGTAPRLRAQKLFDVLPAMLGGGAGFVAGGGNPYMAGLGMAAGAAAPAIAGRAMLSRPGRAYLANQLLAQPAPRTTQELLAAMNASSAPLRLPAPNGAR